MQSIQHCKAMPLGRRAVSSVSARTSGISLCKPITGRASRQQRLVVSASSKGAAALVEGKRVYESGDRLAAMKVYEGALALADLTPEQRRSVLYGMVAVHASFGDVELAQMALRDAVAAGVDWEEALKDPSLPQIQSSPQIIIQLSRFNKQLQRTMDNRAEERAAAVKAAARAQRSAGGSTSRVPASISDADLSRLLGGSADDKSGEGPAIDTSPAAIAKRVTIVVIAGIILGVGLFYAGLEYMFPKI